MTDQRLPEGTDQIIDGDGSPENDEATVDETIFTPDEGDDDGAPEIEPASSTKQGKSAGAADAAGLFSGLNGQAFFDRIDTLKGQGYDQARSYAQSGLDQASGAIDDVVRMINEAADQIDERVGTQYGGYARKAADGIGGFGDYFKDRDVDELFDQARELVKRSPAVAIGTAAALGFVVARLARAGFDSKPDGKPAGGKSGAAA